MTFADLTLITLATIGAYVICRKISRLFEKPPGLRALEAEADLYPQPDYIRHDDPCLGCEDCRG